MTAGSGQNPVTSVNYYPYGTPPQTTVTFGSGDSDVFTYYANTLRPAQYQFNVNGQSDTGTLTWNPNSTLQQLKITDALPNSADSQTCNYTHDDLTRIASANCGTAANQTFSYDPFGNISKSGSPYSFQPTYNTATNRITMVGYTYDANGNVLTDPTHSYAWDADGNSVTVDTAGITYDALDRAVEQNKSGAYAQMVYTPGGAKLAIMSGQTTLQKAFIPLPGQATAIYTSAGLDHYRHSDWLGNARVTSTPARTVASTTAYAPFGETYAQSGTADPSFTGMNQDTTSGDYDFPAREYNSVQGRWASPDPSGMGAVNPMAPQSWNRYAYVLNNPLGYTDPTGLDCVYDMGEGEVNVVQGDCISDTDGGYYVDGTIDMSSSFTLNTDGSLGFGYTNADGVSGVYDILGFGDPTGVATTVSATLTNPTPTAGVQVGLAGILYPAANGAWNAAQQATRGYPPESGPPPLRPGPFEPPPNITPPTGLINSIDPNAVQDIKPWAQMTTLERLQFITFGVLQITSNTMSDFIICVTCQNGGRPYD